MPFTTRDYQSFRSHMEDMVRTEIDGYILDTAVEWVQNNMSPSEIFDEELLEDWARDKGFIKKEG